MIKNELSGDSDEDFSEDSSDEENDDTSSYTNNDEDVDAYNYKRDMYDSYDEDSIHGEDDTVSQSLTNNSQPSGAGSLPQVENGGVTNSGGNANVPMVSSSSLGFGNAHRATVQFLDTNKHHPHQQHAGYPILSQQQPLLPASFSIMSESNNPYNTNVSMVPATVPRTPLTRTKADATLCCNCFSQKRQNLVYCLVLFAFLAVYNSQNLFFYSLSELKAPNSLETIYYCAFDKNYADYYALLNQYIVPLLNLVLFAGLPLALCTMQVLFDVCFLVRVQREQMKRYLKLRDIIEWPLYVYYGVYMVSQVPFALHQVNDLIMGTVKFPFVFPLFIQLKFTSKVWLVVLEMTLIFVAYSSDLFIWIACDKEMRQLAKCWLNKRIFCRTYVKHAPSKPKKKLGNGFFVDNIRIDLV